MAIEFGNSALRTGVSVALAAGIGLVAADSVNASVEAQQTAVSCPSGMTSEGLDSSNRLRCSVNVVTNNSNGVTLNNINCGPGWTVSYEGQKEVCLSQPLIATSTNNPTINQPYNGPTNIPGFLQGICADIRLCNPTTTTPVINPAVAPNPNVPYNPYYGINQPFQTGQMQPGQLAIVCGDPTLSMNSRIAIGCPPPPVSQPNPYGQPLPYGGYPAPILPAGSQSNSISENNQTIQNFGSTTNIVAPNGAPVGAEITQGFVATSSQTTVTVTQNSLPTVPYIPGGFR